MRISMLAPYTFGVLAAAAILVGCNSGALQTVGQPGANSLRGFSISPLATEPLGEHPDHRASWVSPDVKKTREVLFASDTRDR